MTDTNHYASDDNAEGKYIPRSYQFERDLDIGQDEKRFDSLEFQEGSNDHYTYSSAEELLENPQVLTDMINDFLKVQRERLAILDDYSKGHNFTIRQGNRRIGEGKADYRISHNWGGYISSFVTGYIGSIPIDVNYDSETDEAKEVHEILKDISDYNDIDNLNFELMFDASRAGRAYEIHYRKNIGNNKFVDAIQLIDHDEMFVIRDMTIERNIIAAIHLPVFGSDIKPAVYTDKEVIRYKITNPGLIELEEETRAFHSYGDVPVVEWWNNRFREGDWENEIGLFDAYDAAQSDTANYMSDLNDATLVISGDIESSELEIEDLFLMSKANMFLLQSGIDSSGKQTNLNADYIYKQYDVQGTEAYKKRLIDDIYKLVNIPNLDDDRFNNQSGIAIQYKMIGLKQIKETKINYYSKALRRRYELISNIRKATSDKQFDPSKLSFTFHENMPQDVWEEVQRYINAGGQISLETLLELTSFTDPSKEKGRMKTEDEEALRPYMDDSRLMSRNTDDATTLEDSAGE